MKHLSIATDFEFEYTVTRKATTTGNVEAAAGIVTASAWLSLSDGGAAITGTATSLTERSGTAGRYFGILDAAAVNTAVGTMVGRTAYGVLNITGDDLRSEPLMVVAVLPPTL